MFVEIMKLVPAHMTYLARVEKTMKGEDTFAGKKHTECDLGKIYYGTLQQEATTLPPEAQKVFKEIGDVHEAFHAASFAALSAGADASKSEGEITAMYHHSGHLVEKILQLDQLIGGK
jgi:methyl-accepting chemotaxis protein